MYDVKLSGTHDIEISADNDLLLVGGAGRIRQQIKVTLLTWLGEWFLDTRFGVPYLERVLKKNPNFSHIRGIIRGKILAVPGVKSIKSLVLSFDRPTRLLTITYEADTDEGIVKDEVSSGGQ